jgi:hypothetical protein
MSDDWMKSRVASGKAIAHQLMYDTENPIHAAVEVGTAAGVIAVSVFRSQGEEAAKSFVNAMVAIFNQNVLPVDLSQSAITLRMP